MYYVFTHTEGNEMSTTTATATQVYRVDVAYTGTNGRRSYGFTMKNVEATSKEEAGRVAVERAMENDAAKVARFNAEAAKFGSTPQQPWASAQVEKVRRFASDNR